MLPMDDSSKRPGVEKLASRAVAGLGVLGLVAAFAASSHDARSAAAQDWPPFVLVTGLLLVGLVADDDGLFAFAGHRLASVSPNGFVLFAGATLMIGVVTAVLNLDTSVAFLTPVLIYTARSRGGGEAPLLYGCLLLSNAGSLFLPGSNLTNLIVLGHLHLTGAAFFSDMWEPALAALLVTALVIAAAERRELRLSAGPEEAPNRPVLGLGVVAIVVSTVLILVEPSPALAVAAVGIVAIGLRIAGGKDSVRHAAETLGVPLLVGLFGIAVALGTLGRLWYWPATFLSHLDIWATAGVAALTSVAVNNLPAASLLAARTPSHPFALLVGLNLGPNLFVTGSLAWVLWFRVAQRTGSQPSLMRASQIGVIAVPLSMAAALGILAAKGLG
jgi:arsenical pump membrane protein